MATMTLAEEHADVGSTCLHDGDVNAGGDARGLQLSLARAKATTKLAEAHADVGSCSREGIDDGGGGARGLWLSLACVKATTTVAVACMDVISHLLDSEDSYCGGAQGHRLLLARVNDGGGGARGHWLSLRDGENNCALVALLALSRKDDGNADDGTRRPCTTTRTVTELTRHCC